VFAQVFTLNEDGHNGWLLVDHVNGADQGLVAFTVQDAASGFVQGNEAGAELVLEHLSDSVQLKNG